MTTILVHNNKIAADSSESVKHFCVSDSAQKLYKRKKDKLIDEEYIVGFCGTVTHIELLLMYLDGEIPGDEKEQREALKDVEMNLQGLALTKSGKVYGIDVEKGLVIKYDRSQPCATGSGWTVALSAVTAGASIEKAMEVASSLDVYTGGTIHIRSFD